MQKLTVYGHYVSQPTRAVLWALQAKHIPYAFVKVDPISGVMEKDDYLKKFPTGLMPAIDDEGLLISECQAILCYLADKYGWEDWYPKDLQKRAKVNQWLHWHHQALRPASNDMFIPYQYETLGIRKCDLTSQFSKCRKHLTHDAFPTMEFGALNKHDFLTGSTVSLADIAAYCELDQLEMAELIPDVFAQFPNVMKWMGRMKQLPQHDEVRRSLRKLISMLQQTKKTS